MSSRSPLRRFACVLGVLVLAADARGGESPYGDHPRLGGAAGRLRSRISRAPYEEVEVPDVITLKGGVRREAYFLNVYGDRFVYYVRETETSWLREEVPRSEVESVDFRQYLERDELAPRKIEPAKKQPVPKADVLSGVFTASQGRGIRWTLSFQSELDKFVDYAEDATEYGAVEIESSFVDDVEEGLPPAVLPRGGTRAGTDRTVVWPRKGFTRSHEVKGRGKYHLYAPGTVNNDDWVLVIGEVIATEIDHGRDTSIFTQVIPDETFIAYFSKERGSFRLAWSNVGGWAWTSLVGIRFERLPESPAADGDAVPDSRPGPALPRPSRDAPPRPRAILAGNAEPGLEPVLAAAEEASPAGQREKLAGAGAWRLAHWKVDGWKRPPSKLGRTR